MTDEIGCTEKLVKALEAEHNPKLAGIIRRAKNNTYHDYKSQLAMPIAQLVMDLEKLGFTKLANRARNGEFDATKTEADEWAASPEGQASLAQIRAMRQHPENN